MPPSRLHPNSACLACRLLKKRCSGVFPCSNCIQRGRADTCEPTRKGPVRPRRWSVQSLTTDASSDPTQPTAEIHHGSPASSVRATGQGNDQTVILQVPGVSSPEATHRTHPRMLRNLQGEQVYIGKAASLSFLQLLRDTVSQHIGPSQFSHNVKSQDMLETEAPKDVVLEGHFDQEQKRAFAEEYFVATSGLIYVISFSESMELVSLAIDSIGHSDAISALADVIIAIGAQSSRANPTAVQAERFFFARAQRKAFSGLLESPSTDLVRLFLLMSFYMLGACRRNAAFMYLGVASRAAVALGLHNPDTSDSIKLGQQVQRSRIWMSLVILDLLVSSILGRPSATASLHPDVMSLTLPANRERAENILSASYLISLILDEAITRLYGDGAAAAEVAESLLEKLKEWSDNLSPDLLPPPFDRSGNTRTQEHIIGSLHVACSYHFAVIVVTRPFLVSVLSLRLARSTQDFSVGTSTQMPLEDPAQCRLADACIESAVYMTQTCMEVYRSQLLLGNMCILKAFIFAAALIIGFSMFAQREIDSVLEESFGGAIEILRVLARQSAQAAHYFEILTMLANAVNEKRQRLSLQRRKYSRYVCKIFSLDTNLLRPEATEAPGDTARPSGGLSPVSNHANNIYLLAQGDHSISQLNLELDSLSSGWEGLDLPLWDSFPFLAESVQLQDKPEGLL